METLYVAADIAKQSFTSAYWSEKQAKYWQAYANEPTGYEAFAQQVQAAQSASGAEQVHLILEPTGGYELGLALFAYEQGWLVTKPNPKDLRAWATGMGYRAKNDKIDAMMLAEYGGAMNPTPRNWCPKRCGNLTIICAVSTSSSVTAKPNAIASTRPSRNRIPHGHSWTTLNVPLNGCKNRWRKLKLRLRRCSSVHPNCATNAVSC